MTDPTKPDHRNETPDQSPVTLPPTLFLSRKLLFNREGSWLAKLAFWKKDEKDKPEQYRIKVVEAAPASVVSVQDPKGAPDRTQNSEKILALLKDQLK